LHIRIYPLILWQTKIRISESENPAVAAVYKNCVKCACGIVAVLQIIAKATAMRPRSALFPFHRVPTGQGKLERLSLFALWSALCVAFYLFALHATTRSCEIAIVVAVVISAYSVPTNHTQQAGQHGVHTDDDFLRLLFRQVLG